MFHEDREWQPSQRAAAAPPGWRPEDDHEDAWARVLDCGAPGPAREAPALFYQAGGTPHPRPPSPGPFPRGKPPQGKGSHKARRAVSASSNERQEEA